MFIVTDTNKTPTQNLNPDEKEKDNV